MSVNSSATLARWRFNPCQLIALQHLLVEGLIHVS